MYSKKRFAFEADCAESSTAASQTFQKLNVYSVKDN